MKYNRSGSYFYILTVFLVLLGSCTSNENTKKPRSSRIKAHQFKLDFDKETNYNYGDTIQLNVTSLDSANIITNVEIYLNNETEPSFTSDKGIFSMPGNKLGGGELNLKVKTTFDDQTETTRFKTVKLLSPEAPEEKGFTVVNKYPHDSKMFTQGFLMKDGYVYEGTGNHGESRIRMYDLRTGEVFKEQELNSNFFGEGITVFDNKVYQITYKSSRGFIYDEETFEPIDEFTYRTFTGEGWGLTHNDTSLIMSDGSSFLYYRNPENFEELKRLRVFDDKGDVNYINELEYINGTLYANIYTEPVIAEIDPATGMVKAYISLIGIMERSEATANMDVLNGIAYNPSTGNLLVTGKYWSKIYEVKLD